MKQPSHLRNQLIVLILTTILFFFTQSTFAQSAKIITLKDGSQLKGHLIMAENGVYTVETENLGKVDIEESNIVSIAAEDYIQSQLTHPAQNQQPAYPFDDKPVIPYGQVQQLPFGGQQGQIPANPYGSLTGAGQNPNSAFKGQVNQLTNQFMADPEVMEDIKGMMGDPELMQAFQDPLLLKDIMSYDPNQLKANPKVDLLMQNPKMKQLIDKLMLKSQQGPTN